MFSAQKNLAQTLKNKNNKKLTLKKSNIEQSTKPHTHTHTKKKYHV